MTLEDSATTDIAALKRQVKEIIGQVNSLKDQLENREVTLEEFKVKKEALENKLREILELISQYKDIGTKETKHDAFIAEEAKRLMYEFQTEFSEYISRPRVFLSASLVDHFVFDLDFTNYPQKPKLTPPDSFKKLFDVPIDTKIPLLNNWSPQNPPHIVEIFYAIESLFLKIFQADDLVDTNLNMERIEKILRRRKLLSAAEYELTVKDTSKAIEHFQKIIKLSYELDDFERADKYSKFIADLKTQSEEGN